MRKQCDNYRRSRTAIALGRRPVFFSGSEQVISGAQDVIKGQPKVEFAGFEHTSR